MVVYGEGRYRCTEHGLQHPPAVRSRELSTGVTSRTTARAATAPSRGQLVPEDARLDPRSTYAASKVAQEHYTLAWARQAPARATALRYHNVYGPGIPDTPYSGVAAIFRSSLEAGEAPRVFEDGGQMRDFVHVHDVARANLALDRRRAAAPRRVVGGVQRLLGPAQSPSCEWRSCSPRSPADRILR